MRELIIQRIYEIRDSFGGDRFANKDYFTVPECMTNPRTVRRHLAKLEKRKAEMRLFPYDGYEQMTDEELVAIFERIVMRSYQQR